CHSPVLPSSPTRRSSDLQKRVATLIVQAPTAAVAETPDAIREAGDQFWPFRAFREIDDALLRLRLNEPEIGVVVIKTEGDGGLRSEEHTSELQSRFDLVC